MSKGIKLFLAVIVIGVMLGTGIQASRMNTKPKTGYYIAVITKSTKSSYFKAVKEGAGAAATEYNVKMTFDGPEMEEDADTQNQLIEEAVEKGADAIVFSAVDYEANSEAVTKAAEKGVKIIVIDSDVNSVGVECRIGTDNYAAGEMAGKAALELGDRELHIGIVNYNIHTANGQEREAGFRDCVSKDSRVKSVETINVLSTTEDARQKTGSFLRENSQINVIATFNEWTSLGVGWAIRDLDASDKTVVAFDNNVVSIGMLETGEVDALVVQNPYAMGYMGVECAYHLLKDNRKTADIYTDTTVITRENMYSPECQKILFAVDN